MGYLALLFIVVPAVELALLIEVGSAIGTLQTFALIVTTGIIGAALARSQGLEVMSRLRTEMQMGQWPGPTIADGAIILVAGALLVTPGILTDAVGFLMLIPQTRAVIRGYLRRRLETAVVQGQTARHGPVVIDVTPPRGARPE